MKTMDEISLVYGTGNYGFPVMRQERQSLSATLRYWAIDLLHIICFEYRTIACLDCAEEPVTGDLRCINFAFQGDLLLKSIQFFQIQQI